MNADRTALTKLQDDLTKEQDSLITIQWVLTFFPASWLVLFVLYGMITNPTSVDGQILFVSSPKAFDCYSLLEFLLALSPVVVFSIIIGFAGICLQLAALENFDKKFIFSTALFVIFSTKFIWVAFFGGVLVWILD